jgi:hypothetical protein
MEEKEYKDTYQSINQRRCVFEKAISSRRCDCKQSQRFHLADREGIACKSASGNALCIEFLNRMRSNSRFALHLTHTDAPLPHAKEIRVQTGGLLGLQGLVFPDRVDDNNIGNAIGVIDAAIEQYGRIENLPYDIIIQAIVKFEGRKRRPRKNDP